MSETEQELRDRLHQMAAANRGEWDSPGAALAAGAAALCAVSSNNIAQSAGYPLGLHNTPAHAVDVSPERIIAMRTDLIRLCHSNGWTPEQIVDRADIYLQFIINGIHHQRNSDQGRTQ